MLRKNLLTLVAICLITSFMFAQDWSVVSKPRYRTQKKYMYQIKKYMKLPSTFDADTVIIADKYYDVGTTKFKLDAVVWIIQGNDTIYYDSTIAQLEKSNEPDPTKSMARSMKKTSDTLATMLGIEIAAIVLVALIVIANR